MQTTLFKTTALAEQILQEAHAQAQKLPRKPGLAVVLVGSDPASSIYVKKKTDTCRKYGLQAEDIHLDPADGQAKLEEIVRQLNARPDIDGILVQSPLPKGWDERKIQKLISPEKDVDGFHPQNAGELFIDPAQTLQHGLPPCTPAGVMEILQANHIKLEGKTAVVIGRSTIVGKPMALMLLGANATVTIAHSKTPNLSQLAATADILISAVGKPRFIQPSFIKKGAVVIDVGISREGNRVVGDVDAAKLDGIASFVTPVPNGVGPMTIALLIRNTVRAATKRNAKQ